MKIPSAPMEWNGRWAAGIVVLTILAYATVLLQGGWIWDDDDYVLNNPTLRSVQGLSDIWFDVRATPQYYPLVHTSFWVEYQLWGLRPAGYHAVNVLLHAAAAVGLWRVLARLPVRGAWMAAAVFAFARAVKPSQRHKSPLRETKR